MDDARRRNERDRHHLLVARDKIRRGDAETKLLVNLMAYGGCPDAAQLVDGDRTPWCKHKKPCDLNCWQAPRHFFSRLSTMLPAEKAQHMETLEGWLATYIVWSVAQKVDVELDEVAQRVMERASWWLQFPAKDRVARWAAACWDLRWNRPMLDDLHDEALFPHPRWVVTDARGTNNRETFHVDMHRRLQALAGHLGFELAIEEVKLALLRLWPLTFEGASRADFIGRLT